MTTETLDQRAQRLVSQEVLCCMSHLVSTLAKGCDCVAAEDSFGHNNARELGDLAEQAFELASPVQDYEEAARQEGWKLAKGCDDGCLDAVFEAGEEKRTEYGNKGETPNDIAQRIGLEPYEWEVFEHWAVTQWLADKLTAHGEKVDTDFAGLCVWARTCTGQSIAMDSVIQKLAAEVL